MTTSESRQSERVDLRGVWPNEAFDFTPWVADNLCLLGKAVEMELELIQTEAPGWSGFLDILAKRADELERKVAIENQLEVSDSDHFARLLGYAAEHDARELIWVAPQFWEYHLRQIGWLNEKVAGQASIHAVAVRLLPGGKLRQKDSASDVPGFRAEFARVDLDKDGPEWAILREGALSPTAQKYRNFFLPLLGDLRSARFTDRDSVTAGNDQLFPSGYSTIDYHVGFWGGSANSVLSIYLYVANFDPNRNKRIFDALYQHRQEIEEALPGVWWGKRNGQNEAVVGISTPGSIEDPEEKLDEIRAWASKNMPKFNAVIQPCLDRVMSELPPEPADPTPGNAPT